MKSIDLQDAETLGQKIYFSVQYAFGKKGNVAIIIASIIALFSIPIEYEYVKELFATIIIVGFANSEKKKRNKVYVEKDAIDKENELMVQYFMSVDNIMEMLKSGIAKDFLLSLYAKKTEFMVNSKVKKIREKFKMMIDPPEKVESQETEVITSIEPIPNTKNPFSQNNEEIPNE